MTPDDLINKGMFIVFVWIGRLIRLLVDMMSFLLRLLFFKFRNRIRSRPGFPLESRFEHTHVIDGSGHGKTQLLQQLIIRDIYELREGHGSIIVIDSQADMIGKILRPDWSLHCGLRCLRATVSPNSHQVL